MLLRLLFVREGVLGLRLVVIRVSVLFVAFFFLFVFLIDY